MTLPLPLRSPSNTAQVLHMRAGRPGITVLQYSNKTFLAHCLNAPVTAGCRKLRIYSGKLPGYPAMAAFNCTSNKENWWYHVLIPPPSPIFVPF